jgi:hypothetical protein
MADIIDFHEKFDLKYSGDPRQLPVELVDFRQDFMQEELTEYGVSSAECKLELLSEKPNMGSIAEHLEGQLDALVDLVYVALGTAYLQGFDFNEAWRRVHEANMAKVRATDVSQSKRGSTQDVVKPKGWKAPSHLNLVTEHAHRQGTLL